MLRRLFAAVVRFLSDFGRCGCGDGVAGPDYGPHFCPVHQPCEVVQTSAQTFRCLTHNEPVDQEDVRAPETCAKGAA